MPPSPEEAPPSAPEEEDVLRAAVAAVLHASSDRECRNPDTDCRINVTHLWRLRAAMAVTGPARPTHEGFPTEPTLAEIDAALERYEGCDWRIYDAADKAARRRTAMANALREVFAHVRERQAVRPAPPAPRGTP